MILAPNTPVPAPIKRRLDLSIADANVENDDDDVNPTPFKAARRDKQSSTGNQGVPLARPASRPSVVPPSETSDQGEDDNDAPRHAPGGEEGQHDLVEEQDAEYASVSRAIAALTAGRAHNPSNGGEPARHDPEMAWWIGIAPNEAKVITHHLATLGFDSDRIMYLIENHHAFVCMPFIVRPHTLVLFQSRLRTLGIDIVGGGPFAISINPPWRTMLAHAKLPEDTAPTAEAKRIARVATLRNLMGLEIKIRRVDQAAALGIRNRRLTLAAEWDLPSEDEP
ncbi:hypothetical protein OC834_007866 [Tilletia horrida]|nr:hypothetical protein OC834_007866 [Tilletia horrida]